MAGPWDEYADQGEAPEAGPWAEYAEDGAEAPTKPAAKQSKRRRNIYGDVAGFMANVNRGLGIGDELAAGIATGVNALTRRGPQGFEANMAAQRKTEDQFREDRPKVAALGLGTGNALTMAAPVGPGAAAFANGGRAINALRGATLAGLTGAGYAALDRGSLHERGQDAARAAYDPLVLGLGAGAGAIAARSKPRAGRVEGPSLDELQQQKRAAYNAVDNSGEAYTPQQFSGLVDDIVSKMREARFNPRLQQRAAIMLDEIAALANQATGHSPSLSELDDLRKVIGRDVSSSPDAGERRMGQIMREQIDQFIERLGEAGGEASSEMADTIRRARDLNSRVRKIEALDELDQAAADRAAVTGSGGNVENTLRQNVRRFQDSTGNLTPAEREATQRVIRGAPGQNALRLAGKLSPEGNGLMAGVHLLGAVPTQGASVGAAGIGFVAKRISEAITRRNVRELRNLIANGGQDVAAEIEQQLIRSGADDLRSQLANDLSVASGVQGTDRRGSVTVEVVGHPEYGVGVSRR